MHRVDTELGHRLREYFHQARHLVLAPSHTRLLSMMSPKLQRETVLAVNSGWHSRVWFLNNDAVEKEFIVRLTLTLSPLVLAPFELCPHGYLYILHRGVAVYMGQIVTKGTTVRVVKLVARLDASPRAIPAQPRAIVRSTPSLLNRIWTSLFSEGPAL